MPVIDDRKQQPILVKRWREDRVARDLLVGRSKVRVRIHGSTRRADICRGVLARVSTEPDTVSCQSEPTAVKGSIFSEQDRFIVVLFTILHVSRLSDHFDGPSNVHCQRPTADKTRH